jgi:aspartyl-tRNA synthetase
LSQEAKKKANREAREKAEKEKAEKLSGKGGEKKKKQHKKRTLTFSNLSSTNTIGGDQYGNLPLLNSSKITSKVWSEIGSLSSSKSSSTVTIRGHLQSVRGFGKGVFAIVRSSLYTVQCVCFESPEIPKTMVEYISKLSNESIVDVSGVVTVPDSPVEKCTQKDVEIKVTAFHMVAPSAVLPFQMEDACRPDCDKQSDVGEYTGEEVESSDGLIR